MLLDYEELKVDIKRMEHVNTLALVLRDLLGNDILPNPKELLIIYGRVSIGLIMSDRYRGFIFQTFYQPKHNVQEKE